MLVRVLIVLVLGLLPRSVGAAGFALDYEGARALGFATAGGASAEDATTIFYNPAGMNYLGRDQLIVGGALFILHDNFTNQGSTILGGALPTPGTNGNQAFPTTPVPWFYGTHRVEDNVTVGLGLFAPFGLKDDYGSNFVGRYQSQKAALTVVDLNPSIAYRPLPWLSLGAGANIEYARLQLGQAIDFGSLCVVALGTGSCSAAFGLTPGQSDGHVKLTANGFAPGYNFGVLIEPDEATRLGVAYRSGTSYQFGNAKQRFAVPPTAQGFLAAAGMPLAFTGGTASVNLPLPGRLSFAVRQTLSDKLELLFDTTLTFWDVFRTTVITPADVATGVAATVKQHYHNAPRVAAGLGYDASADWTFRGGIAFDRTPVSLAFEQAALPDRNRIYVSAGASYRLSEVVTLDLGISHASYLGSVPIDRVGIGGDRLTGEFNAGGEILAAQIKIEY